MRKRPWLFALVMLSMCLVVLLPSPGLVKAASNVTTDYNGTTSKIDKTYDMQKKIQSDGRINAIVEQKNKAIDQQEGILNVIGVPLSLILLVSFITAIILLVKYFNARRRVRVSTSTNL